MSDRPWLARLRLRVLAVAAGAGLLAWGMIVFASMAAVPVVAVTLAGVTLVVNFMTARLHARTCLDCGQSLADASPGQYGMTCPSCGAISLHSGTLASSNQADAQDDDASAE